MQNRQDYFLGYIMNSPIFVLGADYENIGQHKEAADPFNRCAQITGTMQDKCKELAASTQQEASGAK